MSYPKDIFSRMYAGLGKIDHGLLYPKEEREEVNLEEVDDNPYKPIFLTLC